MTKEYIDELTLSSDIEREKLFTLASIGKTPLALVSSPPGGGKSTILIDLCIYLSLYPTLNGQSNSTNKLIVVTQSHAQAVALANDLLDKIKKLKIKVYGGAGASREWPSELIKNEKFSVLKTGADNIAKFMSESVSGDQAQILVCNSSKSDSLSINYSKLHDYFDYGFVDEAYQMRYGTFLAPMMLSSKWVLVGDPGQLEPIKSDLGQDFTNLPEGAAPDLSLPEGLKEEGIQVPELKLPVSWRLPQDTVNIIQPAFYPNHKFKGAGLESTRYLQLTDASIGDSLDETLNAIAKGESLQMLTLPGNGAGLDTDIQLAQYAKAIVERLLQRNTHSIDYDKSDTPSKLNLQDILILSSRVKQVTELQALLGKVSNENNSANIVSMEQLQQDQQNDESSIILGSPQFSEIEKVTEDLVANVDSSATQMTIDTANRLQGLQAPFVIAIHPCSGLDELSDFDLEIGRLCVMLSRHRIGCILLSRSSVFKTLEAAYISQDRKLENDPAAKVHKGLTAHRTLLEQLKLQKRIR